VTLAEWWRPSAPSGPHCDNAVVTEQLHAITVLGHDRPGIIAETTSRLAVLGLNLEDSTMTLLRGHFAMMLLGSGAASGAAIEDALAPLTSDGTLSVTVRAVTADDSRASGGTPWILSVHGGDRPGIVSSIVGEVARIDGNITDLTTRLSGELYVVIAEIVLPAGVDPATLDAAIQRVARELGVGASLRAAEADDL
jgi:glycine cleavage system transcriptional repressor